MMLRIDTQFAIRVVVFGAVVIGAFPVCAQELEFSISPAPVGAGARAAGMADAFVATADDATSASWNPAGLVQLETPELAIVGAWNRIQEDFEADISGFDSSQSESGEDLNFLSVTYPLPPTFTGRNMSVSLAYQHKYTFDRQFEASTIQRIPFPMDSELVNNRTFTFEQQGDVSTITPSFAIEITNTFSLGIALNLWRDSFLSDNGWKSRFTQRIDSTFDGTPLPRTVLTREEEYENFRGENIVLGALWNPHPRWNIGLRYDSELKADADYRLRDIGGSKKRGSREVRFPETWAFGVAWRPNDTFTLSSDVTRTSWDDFYVENGRGERFSLIDGSNLDDKKLRTEVDSTYTVRLGMEYVFVPRGGMLEHLWTVRAGTFYDEEPAINRPGNNLTKRGTGEADEFYGLAFGIGYQAYHRLNIDLAYQYRWGNHVNQDFFRGIPGFKEDVEQHRVLLSAILYLDN